MHSVTAEIPFRCMCIMVQVGFVLLLLIMTLWTHTTAYTYPSRSRHVRSYHHAVPSNDIKHGTRLRAADKTLVIWDCDGVLVDSEGDKCACANPPLESIVEMIVV